MNYLYHLFIYLSIYVIVALSLNIVAGYCGLLSLAHAGFFAVGSYVYSLAVLRLGFEFFPAIALGVFISMVLSLALSLASWRFKGDFFVVVSLAIQALLFSLLYGWSSPGAEIGTWFNLTNGPSGISGIAKPVIIGIRFATPSSMAALSLVIAGLLALLLWFLLSSPWGRLLKAIRDDELAARGIGKNVRLAKIQAFAISSALVSIAGAIYASYISYVDPTIASLDASILMLCMVLVGGMGNFRGPIMGAVILILLPEGLRFMQIPDSVAANVRLLMYGLLLVLMMHFRPQGLSGEYRVE